MKNLMKALALVLAIGSTIQAIQVYAQERVVLSIDEAEYKLTRLIELKRELDFNRGYSSLTENEQPISNEFPTIKNEEDFKEAFAIQALRYMQAIGGEAVLKKVLQKTEFASFEGHDPGV